MQIAVGTYVGDGSDNRNIPTSLTAKPDVVHIISDGFLGDAFVFAMSTMPVGDAKISASALATDIVQLLNNDGSFEVGTHSSVNNALGFNYWYLAIRDNGAGDFGVTSYIGDSVDDTLIAVGTQPDLVIVLSAGGQAPVFRTSDHVGDQCNTFGSAAVTNGIQGFSATGFTIGTDARVNGVGTIYHVLWAKNTTNIFKVITYDGDGADNRSIGGVGFQPDWTTIVNIVNTKPPFGRASPMVGDVSARYDGQGAPANGIQTFEADGFQIGSLHFINQAPDKHNTFNFKIGTSEALGNLKRTKVGVGL